LRRKVHWWAKILSLTTKVFIRLKLLLRKSAKPREIPRKFELSSSQSSEVIDLGANRKRTCNFLLVISSNVSHLVPFLKY